MRRNGNNNRLNKTTDYYVDAKTKYPLGCIYPPNPPLPAPGALTVSSRRIGLRWERGGLLVVVAIMPLTLPLAPPFLAPVEQTLPPALPFFCRSLFSPPAPAIHPPPNPRLPRGAGDSPSAVKGRGSHDGFHRWSVEIAGKGFGSMVQQRKSQGEKYYQRTESRAVGRRGKTGGMGAEWARSLKKALKKKKKSVPVCVGLKVTLVICWVSGLEGDCWCLQLRTLTRYLFIGLNLVEKYITSCHNAYRSRSELTATGVSEPRLKPLIPPNGKQRCHSVALFSKWLLPRQNKRKRQ